MMLKQSLAALTLGMAASAFAQSTPPVLDEGEQVTAAKARAIQRCMAEQPDAIMRTVKDLTVLTVTNDLMQPTLKENEFKKLLQEAQYDDENIEGVLKRIKEELSVASKDETPSRIPKLARAFFMTVSEVGAAICMKELLINGNEQRKAMGDLMKKYGPGVMSQFVETPRTTAAPQVN